MSDLILAIDPGPQKSAFVVFNCVDLKLVTADHVENARVLEIIAKAPMLLDGVVCETISGFGKSVGEDVFSTCEAVGEFRLQTRLAGHPFHRITRKQIKSVLCDSQSAKDKDVRAALIARWGGKEAAIGTKKAPGPLLGVSSHMWAALAAAVAWTELQMEEAARAARVAAGSGSF